MSTYKGVMYHGTDKNVLRMGEQERKRMLELCNEMAGATKWQIMHMSF